MTFVVHKQRKFFKASQNLDQTRKSYCVLNDQGIYYLAVLAFTFKITSLKCQTRINFPNGLPLLTWLASSHHSYTRCSITSFSPEPLFMVYEETFEGKAIEITVYWPTTSFWLFSHGFSRSVPFLRVVYWARLLTFEWAWPVVRLQSATRKLYIIGLLLSFILQNLELTAFGQSSE